MKKVLIIEDCEQTRQLLSRILAGTGVEVSVAGTTAEARAAFAQQTPDLALLDMSLPDGDGFEFFSELQSNPATADVPVVFITGKQEVAVKVAAFSLGAEDYIVKPFDVAETKARLEAKIRKISRKEAVGNLLKLGELQIDLAKQQVFITAGGAKTPVSLTGREFKLLVYLARNENNVLSREQLLDAVWGNASSVFDRTVDTHISAIRRKLGALGSYIESVKGSGYRISGRPAAKAA